MLEEIREKSSILGIEIDGYRGNFKKAVERKNQVVKELREGIKGLLTMRKVKIFWGFGKIEGGNNEEGFLVSIAKDGNKQIIKGKRIIVATGSTPALIPAFNIDHKKIITSDDILAENFNELPKSLLVIGAGVIGCEFANIFAQYGTKVIMLEFLPTMLATEEKIIIKEMQKKFEKMGIEVNTNVNVLKVEATETGVKATTVDASIPKDKIDSAEKKTFEAEFMFSFYR
jgi:dihydrolipoamide dehydrogenase